MKKHRPLLYTILFVAVVEKLLFWLGVFTAPDPAAQMDGIWKITFLFTLATGYLAYWLLTQRMDAVANPSPRHRAEKQTDFAGAAQD